MKLLRLKADGFGPLRGEYTFDADRVTLVVDGNERGKSSLLAAIGAALYGLAGDRRNHRLITPLDRWRPWDGGPYRIELDLESGGTRYTVTRDFELGLVGVWNDRGQELTHDFREGRDDFPIGRVLFGLDAQEFEKCAFVRQGELDLVVPDEEKARRASTLHARLETAADTRPGDSSASEALAALEEAEAHFGSTELGTTLRIENAIQRLEAKRDMLASEIHALDHDRAGIEGPLEELAQLQDADQTLRERLGRLETDRRSTYAADAQERLVQDDARRAELAGLRDERDRLAPHSGTPLDADAEFRTLLARLVDARTRLANLEERQHEAAAVSSPIVEEGRALDRFSWCTAQDADRLVVRADRIRKLDEDHDRARVEFLKRCDDLSERGLDIDRMEVMSSRFEALTESQQTVLRQQREAASAMRHDIDNLEQQSRDCLETVIAIDAMRRATRKPGWSVWATGIASTLLGAAIAFFAPTMVIWVGLMGIGLVLVLAGFIILRSAGRTGEVRRAEATAKHEDLRDRLAPLRRKWADTELRLGSLAETLGFGSVAELIAGWEEYTQTLPVVAPALQAKREHAVLRRQREELLEETRASLETLKATETSPGALETLAKGIRRHLEIRVKLASVENERSRVDREQAEAVTAIEEIQRRGVELLTSAGLAVEPSRKLAEWAPELEARARSAQRHERLVGVEIPALERLLLDERVRHEARAQIELAGERGASEGALGSYGEAGEAGEAMTTAPSGEEVASVTPAMPPYGFVAVRGRAPDSDARGPADLEREVEGLRGEIESHRGRREEIRIQYEETARRYHAQHPEKCGELETIEAALERARRFQRAVSLAKETIEQVGRETHRRWADFLNARVGELLGTVGTAIGQVRFGEDLDFSVRMPNGQHVSRGKAMLQLSSGARDQLHLAVRLAISEFLSRGGESLPLLIDDCFATSDDERTRAGMKLLLEHLSREHQIVLATCHRTRYQALAALDPELYRERVQWLEVRSAASEEAR